MLRTQPAALAVASVQSVLAWSWLLKVDDCGLFRWYLNGTNETHLRGCTRNQAESALRRFVGRSLRGELQITDLSQRMGVETDFGAGRRQSKETA